MLVLPPSASVLSETLLVSCLSGSLSQPADGYGLPGWLSTLFCTSSPSSFTGREFLLQLGTTAKMRNVQASAPLRKAKLHVAEKKCVLQGGFMWPHFIHWIQQRFLESLLRSRSGMKKMRSWEREMGHSSCWGYAGHIRERQQCQAGCGKEGEVPDKRGRQGQVKPATSMILRSLDFLQQETGSH